MTTAAEFAAGLRRIADWYDAHPEAPLPYERALPIYSLHSAEEAADFARALSPCRKVWREAGLTISRDFGGVSLEAFLVRAEVCERVVTGTREVPAQVTPAHTEEVVEWQCSPLLADRSDATPAPVEVPF